MGDRASAYFEQADRLAHGGVLRSDLEEAGVTVAAYVVGEERLSELREWMTKQSPDVLAAQRVAAVEICIWMANADRNLDPEEIAAEAGVELMQATVGDLEKLRTVFKAKAGK